MEYMEITPAVHAHRIDIIPAVQLASEGIVTLMMITGTGVAGTYAEDGSLAFDTSEGDGAMLSIVVAGHARDFAKHMTDWLAAHPEVL